MSSAATAPAPSGVLYLVATPIGNLEDITARALSVLREADVIAAEDTRVTRKLLSHFDLHTPLVSYHAHSGGQRAESLLDRLRAGQSVALVSDAGTPAISDPGFELVEAAAGEGFRVEPVPGPCAAIAGLIASALPTGRFVFEGFLPRTNDRRERLAEVARERRTVVLYEAANRLADALADLRKHCGDDRRVAVGREITKKFEEFVRGTLAEVEAHYRASAPRGECVIVLDGAGETEADAMTGPDVDARIAAALAQGLTPKDAARSVAAATGLSRNEVYARIIESRRSG